MRYRERGKRERKKRKTGQKDKCIKREKKNLKMSCCLDSVLEPLIPKAENSVADYVDIKELYQFSYYQSFFFLLNWNRKTFLREIQFLHRSNINIFWLYNWFDV